MTKLTEKEVVEQITKFDVDFLKEYGPHIDDVKTIEKFQEDKIDAEAKYNKADENVSSLMKECLIDERSYLVGHRGGYDGDDFYENDLFIAGVYVDGGIPVEFKDSKKVELAKKFVEEYKKNYEKNKSRLNELANGPELLEYNNLVDELNNLQSQKGFFAKIKNKGRIAVINNKLEELKKYADEYNYLKNYVEKRKDAHKVVENLPKLITAIQERDQLKKKTYEYGTSSKLYGKYQKVQKRIKEREKNAEEFKLVEYYREHEAEYKDDRKTLLMIYAENTDKEFQDNFKDMLKAYDQAAKIAKAEGKDFKALKDSEKYDYFEAGQKVVKTQKQMGTYKDGEGKQ